MNNIDIKISYHLRNNLSVLIFIVFVVAEIIYHNFKPNVDFDIKTTDFVVENQETYETIDEYFEMNDTLINTEFFESDKTPHFEKVGEDYFKNTLFIGDSRTVGFKIYKTLEGVTYYANQSFGVYGGFDLTMQLKKFGLVTLGELLDKHKFDKIYICLGINNVATNPENHKRKYREFLDHVLETQPNAIVFLIANLHVTKFKTTDNRVNNNNINIINNFVKEFADANRVFYLDPNPLYDDEDGCLSEYLSTDGYHMESKYYDKYLDFLLNCGVVK